MNQPATNQATNPTRGRILVIDDNPIIQRSLYFILRDHGYAVQMAGELSPALQIVRGGALDAILLDIHFPPDASIGGNAMCDGFWALDWIRRMEEARGIPIIIVSSDPPEKSKAHALAGGAAAYLQKPVEKQQLLATLADLIAHAPPKVPSAHVPASLKMKSSG